MYGRIKSVYPPLSMQWSNEYYINGVTPRRDIFSEGSLTV
jgi:hypothetical protein